MKNEVDLLADLADSEFDGESYNGKPLMATLNRLDAVQAAAESSYEGYSPWSIVLHLAYCKWIVAKSLLDEAGRAELGPYPYPIGSGGFSEPVDSTEESWAAMLSYLKRVHGIAMKAVRDSGDSLFERELPEWGIPAAKAAAWLSGHDSYHTAQIRNMGVPGLREKRAY